MSSDPTLFGLERWSPSQLAEALVLSSQRISQLTKEGILPQPVSGRYAPLPAVGAYVRHLRQRDESRSKDGEVVRKLQIDNDIRSIKLQRLAGELVPVDRVKKEWFECGRRIRDALLNLPSRLSGPFAAESNQEKIFASFTKEIYEVLVALSSGQPSTPATVDVPVEKASAPERSHDETGAMDEAGDCDVQVRTDLDREVEYPEDRFCTGD